MWPQFCIFMLIVNLIYCQSAFEQEANPNLCNFFDTINITNGFQNVADESITFNGKRFAKEYYGIFTYTYLANQVKIIVPAHIRGCVCEYKNCVRLCCPPRYSFNRIFVGDKLQHWCEPNLRVTELTLKNLSNVQFVSEMPCKIGYFLDPDAPLHQWRILPNGSMILGENLDPLVVNRDGYCLAHVSENDSNMFNTQVMFCVSAADTETPPIIGQIIYPLVMLVSVVFLSLTLFIYFWVKELRTLHGKCFMCYLSTLIIGYLVLAFSHFAEWRASESPVSCLILAEITHTSFIAGFIWLSIIGFDIWRTVGGCGEHDRTNQFLKYCLFASGITFLIVSITNLLDHVDLLPNTLRPGLGKSVCWLQKVKLVHFLYLYLIIIIIVTINTIFFILTKLKLDWTQNRTNNVTNSEDSKKFGPGETDADRFNLFFRLVIIMGLPWFIEIVSWLTDTENIVTYIIDIVTMLIGPVIFYLCIKKKRVRRLMNEKWSTNTTLRSNLSQLSSCITQSDNN